MKPFRTNNDQDQFFQSRLSNQLNPKHPLFLLTDLMPWSYLESEFASLFHPVDGAPAKPVRLVTGILMLQHMFGVSDENAISEWVENPYWQFFCGYDFLQWEVPIDPSSLPRWRKRLGVEGMEKIFSSIIEAAVKSKTVS